MNFPSHFVAEFGRISFPPSPRKSFTNKTASPASLTQRIDSAQWPKISSYISQSQQPFE